MGRTPEVLTGARGPRDERLALEQAAIAKRLPGLPSIPEGQVWFKSKYYRLRVQLTAPEDVRLPDGRLKRGVGLVVQFNEGFAKLNEKKDAERIQLLRERENFGIDFWDFQTEIDAMVKEQQENAVTVLRDPRSREAIVKQLIAEGVDFALPTRSKKQSKSEDDSSADAE